MFYLGVDVGGTKTAAAIADETGKILACHKGSGSNYQACGAEESFLRLNQTINIVCEKAGIEKKDITASFLGVAGADLEHDLIVIRQILKRLQLKNYAFENDGYIALRSGTLNGIGILITCGTGSISFAGDGEKVLRKGGFTWFFGERLGSYYVAGLAASAIMRGDDGRGKQTVMSKILRDDYSISVGEMMKKELPDVEYNGPDPIITLIQTIYKAAGLNDCCALEILTEITNEIINIVNSFESEMNFSGVRKIVLEGTVFKKADKRLYHMIENGLGPDYQIVIPEYDPVIGAVMLAMERGGNELDDKRKKEIIKSYSKIDKGGL
jgi:N-acetylglucosamine kinase-like BadF-type ATPase